MSEEGNGRIGEMRANLQNLVTAARDIDHNIDTTRHASNTNFTTVNMHLGLLEKALEKAAGEVSEILSIIGNMKAAQDATIQQARGGFRVAQFLWPLLAALAGIVGGYLLNGLNP